MSRPELDRIAGCLLCGALGDALGTPIEFIDSGAEIVRRHGPAPPPSLEFAGMVHVSDDTQMTLFSAEAILRARGAALIPFALGAYQRWFSTQALRAGAPPPRSTGQGWLFAEPRLHARRAPGNTCLGALAASFARPLVSIDDRPNDSKGCGAVMRAAPFGLAASSRAQAFAWGRDTGVLTHGHPSGYLSSAYLASLVFDLARGESYELAMREADALLAEEPENEELVEALIAARRLAHDGPPTIAAIEAYGGGWVGEEALAIALACALGAESIEDALWRAACHGGDSDSTAAIAGNLIGAASGARALPARWLAELELGDVVEKVADDLDRMLRGEVLDETQYPPHHGRLGV